MLYSICTGQMIIVFLKIKHCAGIITLLMQFSYHVPTVFCFFCYLM